MRLAGVRLFGSWARDEATPDSDVDVCILVEKLTRAEKIEVFDRVAELGWQTGLPLSALVMDTDEFDRLRRLEARLALDIDREGISA